MAELKRVLGFWTILSLSIASILGTGIFFSASIGAKAAGPGVILAWIILTVVGTYIAMFFGELTAMFPKAGGLYEFSKHAYSRFFSFLIGWTAWIIGNITVALVVVASINYLIPSPDAITLKIALSIAFILILNLIAFFGIEASAFLLVILALLTVSVILSFIIPGLPQIDASHYTPLLPFGIASLAIAVFLVSESFFGWESVTYLAEETQNPEKVIPRALVIGTLIVGILGTAITAVALGLIDFITLSELAAPLGAIGTLLFGEKASALLTFGIFATLLSSAAGGIIAMPRLLLALARDKLFLSQLSAIHPTFKTPHKAIIFQTLVSIALFLMAFGRYEQLLSLLLPIGFLLYIFSVFIVLKLRYTHPHVHRPFRVPFAKVGSIFLMLLLAAILAYWALNAPGAIGSISFALSLIFLGMPVYLLLEMYYDPDEIIRINDTLAYLTLLFENIILPKSVRRQILSLLGDVRSKTVLEFGCSVGTFTTLLAEQVQPHGRIFATDLSKREIVITKKRLLRRGHTHVVVIHDEHQVNRVHPTIPPVDCIVSIGMMGYLQDIKKVLLEMRDLVPYGGKIVFVDYVDFFKVIPNVQWLSDDKTIAALFRDAGFSVYVKREEGLFWNYVYVYGIKYHDTDVPYI